ncbi:hypothetical protein FP388_18810 [Citrobacter europaeus]|uniref:HNH endonuclease n=1 Tax=Citrobacter europaeus TaxID=1914243 RepID=UPI001C8E7DFF|nr:hypothetical protein [Citrobacter europaeus]MBY1058802.1 hypothetical protein [Citrobacter europaeus]
MMRNLPIPATDDKISLDTIISEKRGINKTNLTAISQNVKNAYDMHLANSTAQENLVPIVLSSDQKDSLHHAYTSKTKTFKTISSNILFPQNIDDFDECPYCGIGDPSTLDHYIPKELFPEFSVFSKNLIPICATCNSSYKKTKFKMRNGKRIFIHTYYDGFPDLYFLTANIIVNQKIKIDFAINSQSSEPDFSELIHNHFTHLGLKKRFKIKAVAEISRKKATFQRIFNTNRSAQELSDFLHEEAISLEGSYSKNHWKTALYIALSNCMDFCNNGFLKPLK